MFNLLKVFSVSVASFGLLTGVADAAQATGRNAYDNVRTTNVGATVAARMPSMPTLPLISVGNIAVDTNVAGGNTSGGSTNNNPDIPEEPNVPGPDLPPGTSFDECPDGGVANSTYTVENCMNDVLACINNGALPNGLNDMFNADLRASIINGMGLCSIQVEKCVSDVRRNCNRVYGSRADVWIDFNSRKVQPEYYNFVLRKTGLTPSQAENTCLLLDRNAYGKSFAAVNANDVVTGEYNDVIGAYNNQNGNSLSKANPMGVAVNTEGAVDAQRGYYARWDATEGDCLIRVAAYNKDKQISNSWLFGAVGDDQPAEVWKSAGDTFTCNKDLFGFSLLKDTATVATVGVGGGALLGAGIGAAAGAGVANKNEDICSRKQYREQLLSEIKQSGEMRKLNHFLDEDLETSSTDLSDDVCRTIISFPDIYAEYDMMVSACEDAEMDGGVAQAEVFQVSCYNYNTPGECFIDMIKQKLPDSTLKQIADFQNYDHPEIAAAEILVQCLVSQQPDQNGSYLIARSGPRCEVANEVLLAAGYDTLKLGKCLFKTLDKIGLSFDRGIVCSAPNNTCRDYREIREELDMLRDVLRAIDIKQAEKRGATIAKGTAIGTAVGIGAGGVATAITAFVEQGNISCRVGDNLAQVGLNKSYSIDSLKDFYVKWNLNLPDAMVASGGTTVHDLATWTDACAQYSSDTACNGAQFYYKNESGMLEWIYSGCVFDEATSSCNPNQILIKSYGIK